MSSTQLSEKSIFMMIFTRNVQNQSLLSTTPFRPQSYEHLRRDRGVSDEKGTSQVNPFWLKSTFEVY